MTVCKTCSQGAELHGLPGPAGSGQEGQCGWDSRQARKASGGCNEWSPGWVVQQSETRMTASVYSHVGFWPNKQRSFEPFNVFGVYNVDTFLLHPGKNLPRWKPPGSWDGAQSICCSLQGATYK